MVPPTFEDIERARILLKGVVLETPTIYSPSLSRMLETKIFLKMENLQETGSFKERGVYNKLKNLPPENLKRGVIAMSAGNHGQALAYHAHLFQIPSTIVMPLFSPPIKVGKTEKWGARVILAGETFEESYSIAKELAKNENLTFIHPYDDPWIIAGQGTIGIEMLEACPELDSLLIPIGGGGLCAGVALAAKILKPSLKVYGVEIEGFASMAQALYGRKEEKNSSLTLAEGIALKNPGILPQAILQDLLEDIIIVQEEEIERSVDLFLHKQRIVVEGAGAASLAGLLHKSDLFAQKSVGLVVSGGNIEARLLAAIMMRGKLREGFLTFLRIEVDDVPGALAEVSRIIANFQGNIINVKHQRLFYEIPIKIADLDILIESRGEDHIESIIRALRAADFTVTKLSEGTLS